MGETPSDQTPGKGALPLRTPLFSALLGLGSRCFIQERGDKGKSPNDLNESTDLTLRRLPDKLEFKPEEDWEVACCAKVSSAAGGVRGETNIQKAVQYSEKYLRLAGPGITRGERSGLNQTTVAGGFTTVCAGLMTPADHEGHPIV